MPAVVVIKKQSHVTKLTYQMPSKINVSALANDTLGRVVLFHEGVVTNVIDVSIYRHYTDIIYTHIRPGSHSLHSIIRSV